jgi:hypothetical protein
MRWVSIGLSPSIEEVFAIVRRGKRVVWGCGLPSLVYRGRLRASGPSSILRDESKPFASPLDPYRVSAVWRALRDAQGFVSIGPVLPLYSKSHMSDVKQLKTL